MITIEKEKSLSLSPQDRYDVIYKAIECADDDGFLNAYVFSYALYVYAAAALYQDDSESIIEHLLQGSPMLTYSYLLENGSIDKMVEEFADDIDALAASAEVWFEDMKTYRESARGIIDVLQVFTDSLAGGMTGQLDALTNSDEIQNIFDIADKWGINNKEQNTPL